MLSGVRCSVPRIGRTYRRNPDSPAVQGLSRQCKPVLIPNPTAGLNRWKYGERDRSVCARETENRSFNFEKICVDKIRRCPLSQFNQQTRFSKREVQSPPYQCKSRWPHSGKDRSMVAWLAFLGKRPGFLPAPLHLKGSEPEENGQGKEAWGIIFGDKIECKPVL